MSSQTQYLVTKTFNGYPCAHRQWAHTEGCQYVHGYQRSFTIVFACSSLEEKTNFVVDFGALDWVKTYLEKTFDHTLLIAKDDPELEFFKEMNNRGLCKLIIMDNPGMEYSAKMVATVVDEGIRSRTNNRAWVVSVECRENEKNSATYFMPTKVEEKNFNPFYKRTKLFRGTKK